MPANYNALESLTLHGDTGCSVLSAQCSVLSHVLGALSSTYYTSSQDYTAGRIFLLFILSVHGKYLQACNSSSHGQK